jgi:DNA-binding GntR family transcriptional regulator
MRVRDDPRARIAAGEWLPGQMLPALVALAAEYSVSKSTAKKAVQALATDGLDE